jgi:para-nitrobenzyl esterase
VVTHNHRLNVYGYLNFQQLGGEEFASSANVGLLDLVAVLAWVRENVTTFGGDPGCVTIFGQSGGGGKVLALMAMPAAKKRISSRYCSEWTLSKVPVAGLLGSID